MTQEDIDHEPRAVKVDDLVKTYRADWPLRVRIKLANPYGLPVGKEFPLARRKDGDASPFTIEVKHMWPSVHSLRYYSLTEAEVEVVQA